MSYRAQESNQRHRKNRIVENVLVLQGGGSLGAFGCGVFKALSKNGIKFDVVAGTSIGAINAAIIAGSKSDDPARTLEDFWMEVAQSSLNIIPDYFIPEYDHESKTMRIDRKPSGHLNSIFFGVPKMFRPRWFWFGSSGGEGEGEPAYQFDKDSFLPTNWTFTYDHSPLAKTLERYIDYDKIDSGNNGGSSSLNPRLIVTAVDVLTAEPLVFDSAKTKIKPEHLLASSAYSSYGFPWIKVEDEKYAWDGALLSNTPLQEVVDASPRNDKNVYIVENYPRQIDKLPSSMGEVMDRTRDIIFCDKTLHDIRMSKQSTRQIQLIESLYDIFENYVSTKMETEEDASKIDQEKVDKIRKEYSEIVEGHGAEILSINRIMRSRMASPYLLKNADFSPQTVKGLIQEGEQKAEAYLKSLEENATIAELLGAYYHY